MRRLIDVAALHRVVVKVLQLLPHDVRILNLLRMASFLPKLIIAVNLVVILPEAQLLQEHFHLALDQEIDDPPRGE